VTKRRSEQFVDSGQNLEEKKRQEGHKS